MKTPPYVEILGLNAEQDDEIWQLLDQNQQMEVLLQGTNMSLTGFIDSLTPHQIDLMNQILSDDQKETMRQHTSGAKMLECRKYARSKYPKTQAYRAYGDELRKNKKK